MCVQWHSGLTSGYFPYDRGFDETAMFTLYDYIGMQPLPRKTFACSPIASSSMRAPRRGAELCEFSGVRENTLLLKSHYFLGLLGGLATQNRVHAMHMYSHNTCMRNTKSCVHNKLP